MATPDARAPAGRRRRELEHLTAGIAAGGKLSTLLDALPAREAERVQLRQELAVHERAAEVTRLDVRKVERELRAKLDEWTALLSRHAPLARQVLKKLLAGPIRFEPKGKHYYEFEATISFGQMLRGTALARMVASPICASWNQLRGWLRAVEGLREAA